AFGVRARVLDPECTRFDSEEIILRDDGGNGDLGYPWATMVTKERALVVYYFNKSDGTRHIAGTFLEIGVEQFRISIRPGASNQKSRGKGKQIAGAEAHPAGADRH